jgi:hypothetical protein
MSMIYRRLDSSGDYTFGQSKQNFLNDINAVAQAILTRLRLLKGEWWEDTEDGLPLFQQILGARGTNKKVVDSLIRLRILDTIGVTGIETYDSTFDGETRAYTFTAVVNTKYGSTTITNV